MADCPNLAGCPFFNDKMANMPATAESYKNRYCKDDYVNCARYKVCMALGKEKVPGTLFPNMHEAAEKLIAAG